MSHRAPTEHTGWDVAVVGGGVIGLAVAWRAAARGLRTVLLERDGLGAGASHVAAGMLAPVTEATFGEERLTGPALRSAARWPSWARELAAAAGGDPGLRACGSLVVARDRDEAEALEREMAYRAACGLRVERLLPSAARRLEPALAPTVRLAFLAPDEHAVDPRRLLGALARAATGAGVDVRTGVPVDDLLVRGGRVEGVVAGGTELEAATVVLAAGPWSADFPALPGPARVPVRPVKGQVLRLRDPDGPGLLDRNLRMDTGRRSGYLVPRGDGRYVLGATMEERGFDTAVTAGAVHDLVHDAAELVPGVLELELEEAVAGLRPGTPDNAPVLGPGALDGLVWATGHHRNGILLAPLTADALEAVLCGDGLPAGLEAFAAERFAREGSVRAPGAAAAPPAGAPARPEVPA